MLSAPSETAYRRRSAGVAPLALMWLAFGLCLGVIFWVLAAVVLAEIRLDRAEPIPLGWHTPAAEPEALEFPAGVPFGTVLVREGETVRAGQTLVALDEASLAVHADHIRRRILAARYERRCLIDDLPAPLDLMPGTPDIDAETRAQLDAAALRCQTLTEASAREAAPLSEALDLLEARLRQLDAKLALTFRETAAMRPGEQASAALELTLDRNRTKTLIALQTAQRERIVIEHRAARSERADTLTSQIGEDEAFLARIDALRAAPRITAPSDGQVTRVRSVPIGQVSNAPITFAMVTPGTEAAPILRAHLPVSPGDAPKQGTPVQLYLSGDSGTAPQVVTSRVAHVAAVAKAEPGAGTYITVDQLDLADTALAKDGPQLVSARIAYASVPLFEVLWSAVQRAVTRAPPPGDPLQTL